MRLSNIFQGLSLILILAAQPACQNQDSLPNPNPNPGSGLKDWIIPRSEVFDGGPGKDGIPSIDNPKFTPAGLVTFLNPDDLVIGIKVGDEIRAYPHTVLDWHEIVNDDVNGLAVAITYCPLTGTAIGWQRIVEGQNTTFGVSGLLYNSNLIPYDRITNSNWSQMLLKSVQGNRVNTIIKTYPLIETTWATWQQLFPDSKVLTTNTGFSRSYGVYPYGDYKTNHNFILFPVKPDDTRLPRKERGLGIIIDGTAKFYQLKNFAGESVTVFLENFKGKDIVLTGSQGKNFLVAYQSRLEDGTQLQFEALPFSGGTAIMKDQEGNEWSLFGEAVTGPRKGTVLKPLDAYIGYWFAWGAFYPGISIFQ